MRYGIPAYRLSRDVLDAEIARIVDLGVEMHLGTRIDAAALKRLQVLHDAVYIATGATRPKGLSLLPAGAPWWSFGTDYLERCARGEPVPPAARVLVIGGGSAAMDVARSARRSGSEVALLALEPRDRLPAQGEELREALEEGIVLHDGAMLRAVTPDAGGLRLECVRVHFAGASPGAPPQVTPLPGSDFLLHVDHILVAIGQDADLSAFAGIDSANGVLAADRQQRTSAPSTWAGGDVAAVAARFVTEAVGMGKRAAWDIDAALLKLTPQGTENLGATAADEIATWYHTPVPRARQQLRDAGERLTQAAIEVQLALTPAEVAREAARCFSCGTCTSCDNCFQLCPDLAIEKVDGGYRVLADYCKGCGICVRECPTGAMLLEEEAR
jgi:NADPH-dependent glutamate synthase beta subunit-like oxidoreductase/Pyruvate/2-oxoacid:ferredoxin oxidoreductase delta subunit